MEVFAQEQKAQAWKELVQSLEQASDCSERPFSDTS